MGHGTRCAGRSWCRPWQRCRLQHFERELPANRPQYDVMHREAVYCAVIASAEALLRDRHHACSTASPRVAELFR